MTRQCTRQDIIEALAEATERGVIIVTCTQCSSGAVSDDYDDDDDDIDDDGDYIDDDGDYKLSTVNSIQVSGIYETGKALIDIGVMILHWQIKNKKDPSLTDKKQKTPRIS